MMDIVTGSDMDLFGAAWGADVIGDDDFGGLMLGQPYDAYAGLAMGDDLSLGADFLVGAGGRQQAALRRRAVAAKIAQSGTAMVQRKPHKARRFPLGIPPNNVAVGATLSIPVQPQTYFRAERLFVPGTIGPFFSIRDIKVGNVSQFPANVEVPAEIFSQTGVDTDIRLDTNDPAINLSVDVLNISLAAQTFRGAFIGTSIQ